MRRHAGERITYEDVVAEEGRLRGPCTPEEQCGDMHLIIGDSCRCGAVTAPPPDASAGAGGEAG